MLLGNVMQHDEFLALLANEGYQAIVTVTREPNGFLDDHTHTFEAKALILDGELHIKTGDAEEVYRAGDVFHLCANQSHSERYGMQGVRYLVGRK